MKQRIMMFILCAICTMMVMGQVPVTRNKAKKPTPVQTTPKPKPKNNAGKKPSNNVSNGNNGKYSFTTHDNGNKTFIVNGVSFTMVYVQGGTFTMGATSEQGSDAYNWEKPSHSVTLSSYHIGESEVTQGLWEAVMGSNPSKFKGANNPVECVSWNDCKSFISKLNSLTGQRFRLPTEAEWEYAARGGNKSKHFKYSGSNTLSAVAWYWQNSGDTYLIGTDNDWKYDKIVKNNCKTHPVKTKSPNELGLYDMSGNVWEWCQDWYGSYSSGTQMNPAGPSSGSRRVRRGGSWFNSARFCRVSLRGGPTPAKRYRNLGLRLSL